jgi:hypothetical protein
MVMPRESEGILSGSEYGVLHLPRRAPALHLPVSQFIVSTVVNEIR